MSQNWHSNYQSANRERESADVPVPVHRVRRAPRGGPEVHRRRAHRLPGLRGQAAQGLFRGRHRLQGLGVLPHRQPQQLVQLDCALVGWFVRGWVRRVIGQVGQFFVRVVQLVRLLGFVRLELDGFRFRFRFRFRLGIGFVEFLGRLVRVLQLLARRGLSARLGPRPRLHAAVPSGWHAARPSASSGRPLPARRSRQTWNQMAFCQAVGLARSPVPSDVEPDGLLPGRRSSQIPGPVRRRTRRPSARPSV
jgi:hypothetical protein